MRAVVLTFVSLTALAAVSANGAPITIPAKPMHIEAGTGAPIELVRDDCGHGWHRTGWRDRWGYWHWGDCVPNGNPHAGWGARWDYPYQGWPGPYEGWNNLPNWR